VQGDAAIRHADGSYSFHGRSDEVINVGGNRIGTAEIESAILLDCVREGSPVANCAVVGMQHTVLGMAPCAFVVARSGVSFTVADEGRLRSLVLAHVGSSAVPVKFVLAAELPETYSGKYMRGLLRALLTEGAGRWHN
jgi:acrylyl-CoA reductase (NADPH) / 3-hydroxypropionyl-CoA dehydratase / 3-hydroxypropionyl-CoA synthetase